jgi:phytoene dehydrogenase-like protein
VTDVIVIGAGHNGLVAATLLAKSGLNVIVLERTDRAGGCVRTAEIAPGFRGPALAHAAAIDPDLVRSLALERHGLQIARPDADACAPTANGRTLVLWRDPRQAARELQAFSAKDAERYPLFVDSVRATSGVLRALFEAPPPSIDDPSAGDLLGALKAGRAFRSLGKADAYRLLRWLPMAAADFAGEWFESEPLRATVAAGGVLGAFLGPWSAGSTAQLLLMAARERHPIASGWFARGGVGAVADALTGAAREAGVEIRTGVETVRINVQGDGAVGVTLQDGRELTSRAVVSNVDPKRTFLNLVDPAHLDPEFRRRIQNIRTNGTLAKINYAVSRLPQLAGLASLDEQQRAAAMSGRVRLSPTVDDIERAFDAAKYGSIADTPWIELTVPSLMDSSLAPSGQHVISAYAQYAPYQLRGTTWEIERERVGKVATATIERYAPGFASTIIAQQTITPLDLERTYGLTGGHIFHGELALDQLFVARPALGWARYTTPIRNLYLCGSGTHPGTGVDGRSGALAARTIANAVRR